MNGLKVARWQRDQIRKMRCTVENERGEEMRERRIGGAVKLETKGTQSFNRAGPLRDKINSEGNSL